LEVAMMLGFNKDDMETYILASQYSDSTHEEISEAFQELWMIHQYIKHVKLDWLPFDYSKAFRGYAKIRLEIPNATQEEALKIIKFFISNYASQPIDTSIDQYLELYKYNPKSTHEEMLAILDDLREIYQNSSNPIESQNFKPIYANIFESYIEIRKKIPNTHKEVLEIIKFFFLNDASQAIYYGGFYAYLELYKYASSRTYEEILKAIKDLSLLSDSSNPIESQNFKPIYANIFESYIEICKEIPTTHEEALKIIKFFISIDSYQLPHAHISKYVKFYQYIPNSTHEKVLKVFQETLKMHNEPLEILRKYAEMHREFPEATHNEIDALIKIPYMGTFEWLPQAAHCSASKVAKAFENVVSPEALVSYFQGFQGGILSEVILEKLLNYVDNKDANSKLSLTQKGSEDFLEDLKFNQKLLSSSFFAITTVQQWPEFTRLFDKIAEKSGVDFDNYISKDSSISTLVDILNENTTLIKGALHTGFSALAAFSSYQLGSVSVPMAILVNSITYNLHNIGASNDYIIESMTRSAVYTLPNVAIGVASGAIGVSAGIFLVGAGFATALGYEMLKETMPEVASAMYTSYVTSQCISGFLSGNYIVGLLYLPGTINAADKMFTSFFYETSDTEVTIIPTSYITPVEPVGAVLEESI